MIAYFFDRYATNSNNWCKGFWEINSYKIVQTADCNGNSTLVSYSRPNCSNGDLVFVFNHAPVQTLTDDSDNVLTDNSNNPLTTTNIDGASYCGVVQKLSVSNGIYTLTVGEMNTMFDADIFLPVQNILWTLGIEDFIKTAIINNWKTDTNQKFANVLMNVNASTHQSISASVKTNNGIANLKTVISSFIKSYGLRIKWNVSNEGYYADIYSYNKTDGFILPLEGGASTVIDYTEDSSASAISTVVATWEEKETGYTYNYKYVMTDYGEITTNLNHPLRRSGDTTAIYVTAETYEEFLGKVSEAFGKSSYNHKYTITLNKKINYIKPYEYVVGKPLTVYIGDTCTESIITKVTNDSNQDTFTIECGTLSETLTDKIIRML